MGTLEPISLQQYIRMRTDLTGTDPELRQMLWVRDRLSQRLFGSMPTVIAEHHSRSCRLPVYRLEQPDLTIILRDNFYDWRMSVVTPDWMYLHSELFQTESAGPGDTSLGLQYFEGFPSDLVFGFKGDAERGPDGLFRWSTIIDCNEALWTVCFHMTQQLKNRRRNDAMLLPR